MFLLERLTSRSSRSIAIMIAFARSASGGRGDRMGSPDDDRRLARLPAARLFSASLHPSSDPTAMAPGPRGRRIA
jgi:hypothetical protein